MKLKILQIKTKVAIACLLSSVVLLQGCGGKGGTGSVDSKPYEFSIKVMNTTNNQTFSPLTGLLHDSSVTVFMAGQPASNALENLAESGSNSAFINDENMIDTVSGKGKLKPGYDETIILKSSDKNVKLSLLAMLVNTNDAFISLNGIDLSALKKDESLRLSANVYDSGTENNSETSETVPGMGGEGFNATRDDANFVSIHSGVISNDDGLTSSILDSSHRFDNPAATVVITRIY